MCATGRRRAHEWQEATATPSVTLTVLDHPASANGLLAAASCVSRLAGGGRINVLAARVPPLSTIMPTEEVLTADKAARLRAQETARVAALKASFDAWIATAGGADGATEWIETEALPRDLVAEWGRRADIIVVERPERRDRGTTWQALPAALFETDRPVLIVPPELTTPFGRNVAIAWRDDPHATRAVLSALRYAGNAASIHVFAGVRPGAARPRIPDVFVEHGVQPELEIIPIGEEPLGSTLLARAHATGADLLVMGAYAHSPLRELILGGVTHYVLAHADLPVLMRH
jgi:nucleotide-binding universal stress UspA family protein